MAEPPTKRARRTDSSTMWDISDSRSRTADRAPKGIDGPLKRETTPREDTRRGGDYRDERRDDRRHRSRSRDRTDRKAERSRSRERRARGGRDSRRDPDRDGRDTRARQRSTSRDRRSSRRDNAAGSTRYRDRSRSRSRTGSRSPTRGSTKGRARSPPRGSKADRKDGGRSSRLRDDDKAPNGVTESKRGMSRASPVDDMDVDGDDEEAAMERRMQKVMGFSSFKSTQNTKVPGNNVYGVRKEKKTQYRQYMNRSGGFNRPLSPTR